MKKILVAFVITMFASSAFAAEGTAPVQGSTNTDTTVVHKAKKAKKKGKKHGGKKKAAEAAPPAGDAAAPVAPTQ